MCDNDRMEDILLDIQIAIEKIETSICIMEKRDKCRYLCRDRGRHNVECEYFVQKGS